MKGLTDMIEKAGVDKVLHLLVGALLVALASPLGILAMGISLVGVLALSILKEYRFDESVDWFDIWYAMIGGCIPFVVYVFYDALNLI